MLRGRYRFELRPWYVGLICTWLLVVLPGSCAFAQAANASDDGPSWGGVLLDMPANSFGLLSGDPLDAVSFFLFWLPLAAAPFGLFTRIDRE